MPKLQLNQVKYTQNAFSVNDKILFNCKNGRREFLKRLHQKKKRKKIFSTLATEKYLAKTIQYNNHFLSISEG